MLNLPWYHSMCKVLEVPNTKTRLVCSKVDTRPTVLVMTPSDCMWIDVFNWEMRWKKMMMICKIWSIVNGSNWVSSFFVSASFGCNSKATKPAARTLRGTGFESKTCLCWWYDHTTGEIGMSKDLDDLSTALFNGELPAMWRKMTSQVSSFYPPHPPPPKTHFCASFSHEIFSAYA
jgi:hypothetical protein